MISRESVRYKMGQDRQIGQAEEKVQEKQNGQRNEAPQTENTLTGTQERNAKIGEIACLLAGMNEEQLQNMHVYAVDEYHEPNHEAEALEAVVRLSRKYRKKSEET